MHHSGCIIRKPSKGFYGAPACTATCHFAPQDFYPKCQIAEVTNRSSHRAKSQMTQRAIECRGSHDAHQVEQTSREEVQMGEKMSSLHTHILGQTSTASRQAHRVHIALPCHSIVVTPCCGRMHGTHPSVVCGSTAVYFRIVSIVLVPHTCCSQHSGVPQNEYQQ